MQLIATFAPADVLPGLHVNRYCPTPALPDDPVYQCPCCGAATGFNLYTQRSTVLPLVVRAQLDQTSGNATPSGPDHFDLVCLGCNRPARVVYSACEIAMSSYFYIPHGVFVYQATRY